MDLTIIITVSFAACLVLIVLAFVFNKSFRKDLIQHEHKRPDGEKGLKNKFSFGDISVQGALILCLIALFVIALILVSKDVANVDGLTTKIKDLEGDIITLGDGKTELARSLDGLSSEISNKDLLIEDLKNKVGSCDEFDKANFVAKSSFEQCQASSAEKDEVIYHYQDLARNNSKIVFASIVAQDEEKPIGQTGLFIRITRVTTFAEKVDIRIREENASEDLTNFIGIKMGEIGTFHYQGANYNLALLGADPVLDLAGISIRVQ